MRWKSGIGGDVEYLLGGGKIVEVEKSWNWNKYLRMEVEGLEGDNKRMSFLEM